MYSILKLRNRQQASATCFVIDSYPELESRHQQVLKQELLLGGNQLQIPPKINKKESQLFEVHF